MRPSLTLVPDSRVCCGSFSAFWRNLRSLFANYFNRLKMSDAAAAAPAAAKAPKKRAGGAAKAKKPSDHPKYSEMISAALSALKVCIFSRFSVACVGTWHEMLKYVNVSKS